MLRCAPRGEGETIGGGVGDPTSSAARAGKAAATVAGDAREVRVAPRTAANMSRSSPRDFSRSEDARLDGCDFAC